MTTLCAPGDFAKLGNLGQSNPQDLATTVTAIVENRVCRSLALDTRAEWYEPGTTRVIRLRRYPVVSIVGVLTDLSTVMTVQALGNPWRATVAVDPAAGTSWSPPTGLTLTVAGGSTTTLSFATYPTVAQLVAAINGLGGWTASAIAGMGGCPTTELQPTTGALGAVSCAAELLAFATTIDRYDLKPSTGKLTLYQIRPDAYSYPDRTFAPLSPASKVMSIYAAGYNGDPASGPVTSPPDLVEACVQVGRAVLDARQFSGTITDVHLGNSSYKVGDVVDIPDGAARILSKYVDRRF